MTEYKKLRDKIWGETITKMLETKIAEIEVLEKIKCGNYVIAKGERGLVVAPKVSDAD